MNERGVLDAEIAHIKMVSTVGRKNDAHWHGKKQQQQKWQDNATTINVQQLLMRLTDYFLLTLGAGKW